MTPERYNEIRQEIIDRGYDHEIQWAQNVQPPPSPEFFADEAIWVILCSGMKEQVARIISDRVWYAIQNRKPIYPEFFKHEGKAKAIETIWRDRSALFEKFRAANDKVEFCKSLPWIGDITKWHLAKNYGVDCAKPDIHLMRLAHHYKTTPAELCGRLAAATGDRIATVDLVIWRACNLGIIKTRELA